MATSRSKRAWAIYLAAVVVAALGATVPGAGPVQPVAVPLLACSSVVAVVAGVRLHRPSWTLPWLALGVGLALNVCGDVVSEAYQAAGSSPPTPSAADVFFLASYPAMVCGLMLFVRRRARGSDVVTIIDGSIVAIGVGVGAWVFLLAPYAHSSALSAAGRVVAMAYPVLDLLLVAVVVRLWLARGEHIPSLRLVAAGVGVMLVADAAGSLAALHDSSGGAGVITFAYLVSYALAGATALHPSMARLSEPVPENTPVRSHLALALLSLATAASPLTLIIEGCRGKVGVTVVLLAVSSIVMFGLVLVRLALMTRALDASNRGLASAVRRQRALTDVAVAFVAADDVGAVADAAVRAVVRLSGEGGPWAAYVADTRVGATVLATAGPCPWAVGTRPGALGLAGDGPGAARAADSLSMSASAGLCRSVPVVVGAHRRGELVIGSVSQCSHDRSVLDAVCSQMALALQGLEASAERAAARGQRHFRSLVQNSSDVVTLLGADAVVRYQSPSVQSVLGRAAESYAGRTLSGIIHGDDLAAMRAVFHKVLAGGRGATAHVECRVRHADESWRDVDTTLTNLVEDPDVEAVVLNSRDVTVRRTLERELHRQAFRDALTGLANRALFLDRVTHALDRDRVHDGPVAVLVLDLDDFKTVNDSLGHPAGDELLVAVANRIKASTRPGDTVARLGGDEFGVLLETGTMPDAAQTVARRVADALAVTFHVGGHEVSVRASVGIATGRRPGDETDSLLRDADLAMYMAKHKGKGRFELFHPAMHAEALRRLEVTADLRRALDHHELQVFYQPIVAVATGRVVGAEALVRWHHPTRGLMSPDEFIPVAEVSGLVLPLGAWVFTQACLQWRAWRAGGAVGDDFSVSVNVSARQLQDPALVGHVVATLGETGVPPGAIVLEITESALMEDLDVALDRMRRLKALGLRLAVDDYGTGYSSLTYLRILPMDVVKIDKTFMDRATVDAEGAAMVRSVIDLSQALGLGTVAEGVERPDQLSFLRQAGCDNAQGFLFARPVPGTGFARAVLDVAGRLPAASPAARRAGEAPAA